MADVLLLHDRLRKEAGGLGRYVVRALNQRDCGSVWHL